MKKQYFVQHPDPSILNDFSLPKDIFQSVEVGIRDMEPDFLFTLAQNMFAFPVFFALDFVMLEHVEKIIMERNMPFYRFDSDGFIVKIDSVDILAVICESTVELASNGMRIFIFFGEGLSEADLVPTKKWGGPTEFRNLDFGKVETFIDVQEVGLTVFTKNEKYNTPRKVTHCISEDYALDLMSSDLES
ncbi:hypothetical protein QWY16_11205 [Planococcus shenhongbingii]|uniref:hypothetical protein n=1 Tax=Planococcus shenhongbingii TaxID=3058398 RepID=UPI002607E031|nr:hypothetical protein [Planococcus sp. N016]WKA57072.1 hypothetical protein QWY16_11205 [Planococcus sp. N016]